MEVCRQSPIAGAPPEEVLSLMNSDTDEPMRPGSVDDLGLGSASDNDPEEQGYINNSSCVIVTCTQYS